MSQIHVILLIALNIAAAETQDAQDGKSKYLRTRELGTYFNIKMYWKSGYRWQGSTSEKKWCMKCISNSCSRGSGIKIEKCDTGDSRQQFYYDDGRIRSRKNKAACFERDGRSIKLRSCSDSRDQKWDELSKSNSFQLKIPGNNSKCASQHHHPKSGEKIYMTSCKLSSSNRTDKWIVY